MKREMPKKTQNVRDYGVIRRRIELMYWLSVKRVTNYMEIQQEFHINPYSVKKDLNSLENDFDVPLLRTHSGIRVVDGWYALRPHFKTSENLMLCNLMKVVPEEYKKPLEQLIRAYGNPTELMKSGE